MNTIGKSELGGGGGGGVWQVNEVNIVVKCSDRFPLPKTSLLEDLKFRDRESVKSSHNNGYLVYLTFCKSAVCVCCTPHPSNTELQYGHAPVFRHKKSYCARGTRLKLALLARDLAEFRHTLQTGS